MSRCILLLLVVASFAAFAGPTQFETVIEAIESSNEYTREGGDLKLLSESPLHVLVMPRMVKGDFPEVIDEISRREVVYIALLAFAHTSVAEIKITVTPVEIDFKSDYRRPLKPFERTASVSRERFDSLVQKHLGLGSVRDLVGDQVIEGMTFHDMPLDETGPIMYNDQGPPGLDRFFGSLVR